LDKAEQHLRADIDQLTKQRDGWHERCKELIAREPKEEERQMMLLAFAKLAIERPGWDYALNLLALRWDDGDERAVMYDQFREMHKSVMTPEGWGVLLRACVKLRRALNGEDSEAVVEGDNAIILAQNEIIQALPEQTSG
jgi:hypothetical protein